MIMNDLTKLSNYKLSHRLGKVLTLFVDIPKLPRLIDLFLFIVWTLSNNCHKALEVTVFECFCGTFLEKKLYRQAFNDRIISCQ